MIKLRTLCFPFGENYKSTIRISVRNVYRISVRVIYQTTTFGLKFDNNNEPTYLSWYFSKSDVIEKKNNQFMIDKSVSSKTKYR